MGMLGMSALITIRAPETGAASRRLDNRMVHEYVNGCAVSRHTTSAFARSPAAAWWATDAAQQSATRATALADSFRNAFAGAVMGSTRNLASIERLCR
jgi:hypothetical protein